MKIKTISILFILTYVLLFSFGCATQKPMYFWGDYSGSLYKVHKDPNEKNVAEHQAQLETIIKQSEEKDLRVPPGVYGELGYIYALKNNSKLSEHYIMWFAPPPMASFKLHVCAG